MYCLIRTNNKKYDASTFTTAAYPGHSLTSLHLTIFAQQSRICGQTQINRTRFTVSLLVRISTHTDIIKFYFCYLRTQIKAKYELAWLISVNTYTFDTFRITTVFRVVSFLIQPFTLSCTWLFCDGLDHSLLQVDFAKMLLSSENNFKCRSYYITKEFFTIYDTHSAYMTNNLLPLFISRMGRFTPVNNSLAVALRVFHHLAIYRVPAKDAAVKNPNMLLCSH
jgi:hypothetical protein